MRIKSLILWRNCQSGAVEEVTLHPDKDAAEFYLGRANSPERTAEVIAEVWIRRAPDLQPYRSGKAARKMAINTDLQQEATARGQGCNMKNPHIEQLENAGARIRAGQRVHIRREWQDAGDDKFIWVAIEDEDGGRVRISAVNTGLMIPSNQVVETRMLEEGK
jgi:hypothetical protein